jgi:hypothetical protein
MNYSYLEITSDADLDTYPYSLYNYYGINAYSGPITITLPQITSDDMNFKLVRIDSNSLNVVTLQPKSGNTINSNASMPLNINNKIQPNSIGNDYLALFTKFSFANL